MTASSPGRRSWLLPALLAGVAMAAYAPSLRNQFVYDDHQLVLEEPAPRTLGDVAVAFVEPHCPQLPYYRPLVRSSLLLQKLIHGDRPAAFQAVNVALAGVLAIMAYFLLRAPGLHTRRAPAALGSLIVSLHPAASECVYSVSSGREALAAAIFSVLAVGAYLRGGRTGIALAVVALAAGLLSKEQAIVIPLLFFAADLSGAAVGAPSGGVRQWLGRYAAVAAVVAGYLLIRWLLFRGAEAQPAAVASPALPALSILYALQTILAPFRELVYEPPLAAWLSPWRLAIAVAGLLVLAGWAVRRRRAAPAAVRFWPVWLLLTLLPTANLLRQEVPFAERWMLLPCIGVVGLAAALASLEWDRPRPRVWLAAAGALLAVACALVTAGRRGYYADSAAFVQQWLRISPASVSANAHLGYLHFREGRHDEAIAQFSIALGSGAGYAMVHEGRGSAYLANGELEEAARDFAEAARLDPRSVTARYKLGTALARLGDRAGAIAGLREAVRLDPGHAYAHLQLGLLLDEAGDATGARRHYEVCLRADPDSAAAHANLAGLLARAGELGEALRHYRESLRLDPTDPRMHGNLANALVSAGRADEARTEYLEVLRLKPDSTEACFNLGLLSSRAGRIDEAVHHYDEALRLAPDSPTAANNLAWILATQADERHRDPPRALALAERLQEKLGAPHAVVLDTLAAAHAAAGRFTEAAETARAALREAEKAGRADLAAAIRHRLQLYGEGQPYREEGVSVR